MKSLWQDVRFAARCFVRTPVLTAAAVLTLGLGIGAVSAISSVVYGVLLRPLPYPDPERLVLLNGIHRTDTGAWETWSLSYLDFLDWRAQTSSLAEMAAFSEHPESFNLASGSEAERVSGELVSANYFRVFGLAPRLGRTFSPEEDRRGAGRRVAILGYDLWQRRFGGDRRAVGRSFLLNGESYTVVGVMPPRFRGMSDEAEVWLPVTLADKVGTPDLISERFIRWLSAVGRLAPGRGLAAAQGELDRTGARLEREFARTNKGYGIRALSLVDSWFGDLRKALLMLFGAAAFVLLIACTNVANLLLAQVSRRERELALRAAVGASPRRLFAQLLTESALLALLGAAVGLLLARWITGWLVAASAVKLRSFVDLGLDPAVVAIILLVALLCGIGFGVLPAWTGGRAPHAEALKEGGRGATAGNRRAKGALVVTEVALALLLLAGAVLMVEGFRKLRGTDLGFRSEGVLSLRVDVKGKQYTREVRQALTRQFLDRAGAVPGAQAVVVASPTLPSDDWWAMDFVFENRPPDNHPILPYHAVTPGYFKTLQIPLLSGRDFTLDDTGKVPVVIVAKALAERIWRGENAVGKRMKSPGPPGDDRPWLTVIGVVGDISHHGLDPSLVGPGPDVYLPLLQLRQGGDPTFNFLVRSRGVPAASLAPAVRRALLSVTPTLPVYDVKTLAQRLDGQAAGQRFLSLLMGLFSVVAVGLAAIGIYGVVSHGVAQRRREIGVRLALGARRADVLGLILGQTLRLAAGGAALGIAAAWALRRTLSSQLAGLVSGEGEVGSLALATLALLAVALVASLLPARAAARLDPATTLADAETH